jgi:hypothetical protein
VPALIIWALDTGAHALLALAAIVALWSTYFLAAELVAHRKGVDLAPTLDPSDPRTQALVARYLAEVRREPPPLL